MKKHTFLSSPVILLFFLFNGLYSITGLLMDSVFLALLLLLLADLADKFLLNHS